MRTPGEQISHDFPTFAWRRDVHAAFRYPGREDLSNHTAEVCHGWWVGTNYSRADVRRLLRSACQVAGIVWEVDLMVEL